MKKFVKSVVFAVAMLLSVNGWANQPAEKQKELVTNTHVEQVKSKLEFKRCNDSITITIDLSSEKDCGKAQSIVNQISVIYTSIVCD